MHPRRTAVSVLAASLLLAGCGGGSDEPDTDATAEETTAATDEETAGEEEGTSDETTEDEPTEDEPTEEPSDAGSTEEGAAGAAGAIGAGGSATLTVGEETYEFDNYYCLSGPDTGNDNVPFSSGAFGEVDGVRVQLDASILDLDGEGRTEGAGAIQSVTLDDVEDFEDPSVSWQAETGFFGEPEWNVVHDGSTVTAEATFDDGRTDEIEEVPGTLEATCGS